MSFRIEDILKKEYKTIHNKYVDIESDKLKINEKTLEDPLTTCANPSIHFNCDYCVLQHCNFHLFSQNKTNFYSELEKYYHRINGKLN